jgi:tetratricopeptide (TPR) repeat protein
MKLKLPPARLAAAACALLLAGCAGLPRQRPLPPYEAIQERIEAGDPEAALALYDQAMRGQAAQTSDRLLRVQLLLAAGRTGEARTELEGLVAEHPDEAEALAALGRLYQEAGDVEGARGLFERAVQADPGNFIARHGLGRILLGEGRYAEALENLDRALQTEKGFSYAYADRAQARAALDDRAGAEADLQEAIRLDPSDPWNHLDLGRLRLAAGRLEQAAADFSRALELDPANFLARVLRAGIREQQGRSNEAIGDYEEVLRLRPDYYFAYASLGELYYIESNWEPAGRMFQKAYQAQPGEACYALLGALCLKQAGRGREAVAALNALAPRLPAGSWELEAARYLADPAREPAMLAAITRGSDRLRRGRLLFYLGSQFLLEGRTRPALTCLSEAAAVERRDLPEQRIAAALMKTYETRSSE